MKISLLVSVRPNSPFIQQFKDSFNRLTEDKNNVQLLLNDKESNLGRFGLHHFFNDLLPEAEGDLIMYMCDDHELIMPSWDRYIEKKIEAMQVDDTIGYSPDKLWVFIPRADNTGTVCHIMTKGFVKTLGHISMHSHVDSYLNYVLMDFPGHRIIPFQEYMYTDHTVDTPAPKFDPMEDDDNKIVRWNDPRVNEWIAADQLRLKQALTAGL